MCGPDEVDEFLESIESTPRSSLCARSNVKPLNIYWIKIDQT